MARPSTWFAIGFALYLTSWFLPAFRGIPVEFGPGWWYGWEAFVLCGVFAVIGWGSLPVGAAGLLLLLANLEMLLVMCVWRTQWLTRHVRWLSWTLGGGAAVGVACVMVIATGDKAGTGSLLWIVGIVVVLLGLIEVWAQQMPECGHRVPPN